MKKLSKNALLSMSLALGIAIPSITAHASDNSYKTYTCYNATTGNKYCTNSASLVGGGGNITFSQQSTLYLYNSYFTYEMLKHSFTVNSGNPYFMDTWIDTTTASGMGTTKYFNAYKGEFLKNYSSVSMDGTSLKSTYQTSGSNVGYGGQYTTLICSDLVAAGNDVAVVFNMIQYPRK